MICILCHICTNFEEVTWPENWLELHVNQCHSTQHTSWVVCRHSVHCRHAIPILPKIHSAVSKIQRADTWTRPALMRSLSALREKDSYFIRISLLWTYKIYSTSVVSIQSHFSAPAFAFSVCRSSKCVSLAVQAFSTRHCTVYVLHVPPIYLNRARCSQHPVHCSSRP